VAAYLSRRLSIHGRYPAGIEEEIVMLHPLSEVFVRSEADYRIERTGRLFARSRRTRPIAPSPAPVSLPRQRTNETSRPSDTHVSRPAA
jgi:hypothetical protein